MNIEFQKHVDRIYELYKIALGNKDEDETTERFIRAIIAFTLVSQDNPVKGGTK